MIFMGLDMIFMKTYDVNFMKADMKFMAPIIRPPFVLDTARCSNDIRHDRYIYIYISCLIWFSCFFMKFHEAAWNSYQSSWNINLHEISRNSYRSEPSLIYNLKITRKTTQICPNLVAWNCVKFREDGPMDRLYVLYSWISVKFESSQDRLTFGRLRWHFDSMRRQIY